MLTCYEARLLLRYDARPGTPRKGIPELGFHLAECADCRSLLHSIDPSVIPTSESAERASEPITLPAEPDADVPSSAAFPHSVGPFPGAALLDDVAAWGGSIRHESASIDEVAALSSSGEASAAARPRSSRVSYYTLLRNPNFFRLWLGQAVSTFGSFFTRIAVPIYVFGITSSYTQLGFAYFSSVIAPLMFGLVAGVLADRWDRRRTMVTTATLNGAVLVALIICTLLPLPLSVKLVGIYTTNFFAAVLQEMFRPARVAIFADILAEDELLAANSLDGATTTFGEFLSYPIAAAALFYIGPSIAFAVDAVSFFVAAVLIAGVVSPTVVRPQHRGSSMLAEIGEGLGIANRLPLVRKVILLSLVVPLCISLLNALQLPYSVDALRSSKEVGFPALEAAMALGVVVGMLLLGRVGQHIARPMLLAYGILGYGLAIIGQGLTPQLATLFGWTPAPVVAPWTTALLVALPFALLSGAANSMINASIRTMLQEQTPRAALGRVFSVVNVVAGLGFAGGALLTGFAQGRAALMLTLIGVLLVLLGSFARWWLPERRSRALTLASEY